LEKDLKPAPLTIRFTARSPGSNKSQGIPVGVHLEPRRKASGRGLPMRNSPSNRNRLRTEQKYHVTFDKNFFPKRILLERTKWSYHPPFVGAIKSLEFYQDPRDPAFAGGATLEFTHRVDHVRWKITSPSPYRRFERFRR